MTLHEAPVDATVEWYTPGSLFVALGDPEFDLDPASASGDVVPADCRTETAVYQRALYAADAVCLLRERLWFTRRDGVSGRSSFGSTLFAFGPWAAYTLREADIGWVTR